VKRAGPLVGVALLLVTSVPASAQPQHYPQGSYEALTRAPVGSWAEYTTTWEGSHDRIVARFSLVARSEKEIVTEIFARMPATDIILHVVYQPSDPDTWTPVLMTGKEGIDQPTQRPVPPGSPPVHKGDEPGKLLGTETIQTRIGTFACKHYRKSQPWGDVDLWMSDQALPVGFVKQSESSAKKVTVLTATGTGATAELPSVVPLGATPQADPTPAKQYPEASYEALMKAPVGSWAEYSTTSEGSRDKVVARFSLVAKSEKEIIVELLTRTLITDVILHVVYQPSGPDTWNAVAATGRVGGEKPARIPVPPDSPPVHKGDEPGKLLGTETIQTRVGSFACRHYHQTQPWGESDLWRSDQALPVGFVKQRELSGKRVTILTATGTGATALLPSLVPLGSTPPVAPTLTAPAPPAKQ
jgi:hypothetical protein